MLGGMGSTIRLTESSAGADGQAVVRLQTLRRHSPDRLVMYERAFWSDSVAVRAFGCAGAVILETNAAAGVGRCGCGDRRHDGECENKSKRDFGHHGLQPRYVCALGQPGEHPRRRATVISRLDRFGACGPLRLMSWNCWKGNCAAIGRRIANRPQLSVTAPCAALVPMIQAGPSALPSRPC
jgi:hypothetical protein